MMWECKNGDKIEIKDMADRHIINTLNLIPGGKLVVMEAVFNCLVKEAVFRKIIDCNKASDYKEVNKHNLSLLQFVDTAREIKLHVNDCEDCKKHKPCDWMKLTLALASIAFK